MVVRNYTSFILDPTRAVRYGQKNIYHDFLIFFSISILITILTQTDMLYLTHLVFAHLTCFCTSYLSCTSCLALFFILLHILLFISFFYLYICSCVVLLLYNFYSLHCPLSGPDLIFISLLIIPCIIYHVTNKETLNLYSYKCILCEFETYFQRKPIRPFPKSCNMSLEQTNGKIHIYIYIYIYIICICE